MSVCVSVSVSVCVYFVSWPALFMVLTSQAAKWCSQKQGAWHRLILSLHVGAPGGSWGSLSPLAWPDKIGGNCWLGCQGPQRVLC